MGYGARRGVLVKKFFLCLLFVLMLGIVGYMVVLGQRYTARKESSYVDYSAAVGEMMGQFGQLVKNVDADTANQVFDFVKDKIDSGALDSREGLKDALQEGREQFGVEISEADAQKIVDTVDQLEQFGFSPDTVIDEAKSLYEKYGEDCVNHVNEVVTNAVKDAASDAVDSFADYLKESVTDTLHGIFK